MSRHKTKCHLNLIQLAKEIQWVQLGFHLRFECLPYWLYHKYLKNKKNDSFCATHICQYYLHHHWTWGHFLSFLPQLGMCNSLLVREASKSFEKMMKVRFRWMSILLEALFHYLHKGWKEDIFNITRALSFRKLWSLLIGHPQRICVFWPRSRICKDCQKIVSYEVL